MKDNAMSKAQTDVVAALRIELDATKAALAKVVAERDALTKQVEALSKITRSIDTPALVDEMLKSEKFARLYGDSIKELEAERDSLRERLGDAERVIEAARHALGLVRVDPHMLMLQHEAGKATLHVFAALESWRKGGK